MSEDVFWEDIAEGQEIPPLVKKPTTQDLVKWAGASGDFYQIHYDTAFALNNKLPGVIVHGALKSAWLGQLLGDWVGLKGVIKTFGCSYRGMDVPGDTLTCRGKISKKYQKGEEHLVELEIWIENDKGDKNTPGTAVVALPIKTG